MSFTAINCVAIQAKSSAFLGTAPVKDAVHAVSSETEKRYDLHKYFSSSFLILLCCGSENVLLFPCMSPAPQARTLNHASYVLYFM